MRNPRPRSVPTTDPDAHDPGEFAGARPPTDGPGSLEPIRATVHAAHFLLGPPLRVAAGRFGRPDPGGFRDPGSEITRVHLRTAQKLPLLAAQRDLEPLARSPAAGGNPAVARPRRRTGRS